MKPFIVAEMSCNHLGSLERALRIVDAAAAAGADAVKLQTWSVMAYPGYKIPSGPWAGRDLAELYAEAKTPWEWHEPIFERCKERGIVGFASVFDTEALLFLETLGCPMYKISSFEITDLKLISAVAKTGKPMIVSTGMATELEIHEAMDTMIDNGAQDITLLKCTSSYPASIEACNLATIADMRDQFRCEVGVSDHTLGTSAAIAATALGATMIEKHLTLARADGGPDAGFSAEPAELAAMVAGCREARSAIGEVHYGPTEEEKPSLQFRRSLFAKHNILAGQPILPDQVIALRPAIGLSL